MCIRDSTIRGGYPADRVRVLYNFSDLPNAPKKTSPGDYICLLYTSDAADERSSVDLGGRRIIKKKKIQEDVSRQRMTYNKK